MAPTFDELITAAEVEREQIIRNRERAQETIRTIVAKAKRDGRANLTPDEDADIEAAAQARKRAEDELRGVEHKLQRLREAQEAERRNDERLADIREDPQARPPRPAYDQVARVGQEERTYHRGNSGKGGLFLRDVVASFVRRDIDAETRLARHMQEERVERGQYLQRAAGTGNFAGLVVPQYLTEMYAPLVRALRPFADICNKHDLPAEGMTVNISRITTGTTVTNQATEGTEVGHTDPDDTLLTEPVLTASGYADLSRQAVERGTGIEDVTMSDLQRAMATNLDSTMINQAASGLSAVAQNNTYDTTATPTVVGLYPKILQALAGAEDALLGQAMPNYAIMHSRRWYWMSSELTQQWPFIQQPNIPAAGQTAGTNEGVQYGSGVRGYLPNGLAVVVDNNVRKDFPTGTGTQDEIYVVASDECHLWEDPAAPQFIRAEQVLAHQLSIRLVLYTYFAFSLRRYPNGMQKISGTGLVTPTFGE